jgi:hypothetical protein
LTNIQKPSDKYQRVLSIRFLLQTQSCKWITHNHFQDFRNLLYGKYAGQLVDFHTILETVEKLEIPEGDYLIIANSLKQIRTHLEENPIEENPIEENILIHISDFNTYFLGENHFNTYVTYSYDYNHENFSSYEFFSSYYCHEIIKICKGLVIPNYESPIDSYYYVIKRLNDYGFNELIKNNYNFLKKHYIKRHLYYFLEKRIQLIKNIKKIQNIEKIKKLLIVKNRQPIREIKVKYKNTEEILKTNLILNKAFRKEELIKLYIIYKNDSTNFYDLIRHDDYIINITDF